MKKNPVNIVFAVAIGVALGSITYDAGVMMGACDQRYPSHQMQPDILFCVALGIIGTCAYWRGNDL